MYRKIIDNFRNRLRNVTLPQLPIPEQEVQQNINQPPSVEENLEDNISDDQEPIPSTSAAAYSNNPRTNTSVPKPLNANLEFSNFTQNPTTPIEIFENDQIKIFIEKKLHQRHKRFRLQDFLYNVKIEVKENVKTPLLKDLLDTLEQALTFILDQIRSFFNAEDHNLVYVDLFQSPMINALNSGGYLLSDPSNEIIERILGILNQFLISDNNINLEINDTFKIFINVFSVEHANYTRQNLKNPQPNRRKKHYGVKKAATDFKMTWAIDPPETPFFFKNKCFLLCIILGLLQNGYYKSNRTDTRYIRAQGINYDSRKKQNIAVKILTLELQKLIENLSLSPDGPYDFIETGTKISEFYQCQIFVFTGMESSSKLKYVIPQSINDELIPIYLYEPFADKNHIIYIKNLQSYFKFNRKICFDCLKVFKNYRHNHRCNRRLTCFACRRKFARINTYIHEKTIINFCDSKIKTNAKVMYCEICNCTLKTNHCKLGHKKICNGKGQFGYKCLKCKKFTYRRNNDTSATLKQMHQCGVLRCNFCSSYYNANFEEDIHLCALKKETCPNKWPNLCFLKIVFQSSFSKKCSNCLKKKMSLAENMCYDCDCETIQEPNLLVMYKEHSVRRGLFDKIVLSNVVSNITEENCFNSNYTNDLKTPTAFVKKCSNPSQDITMILNYLKKTDNLKLPLIVQFFKDILIDPIKVWFNTTFILHDEDSIALNFILEQLLNLGIAPQIVRNGKNIFLLSLPHKQIKFIRINNYLSGDEYDLATQFNVPFEKLFFPEKFNCFKNFDYEGLIPDMEYFFTFTDSKKTRLEKINFVEDWKKTNYSWCFQTELLKSAEHQLDLIVKSSLNFIKECLLFQDKIQGAEPKKFIHPFGVGLCTIAGFTYKLFKYFYLNNFPIFSIRHETGLNSKEISRQEAEWAAFYHYKYPDLKWYSALGHPKGQYYFFEAIPDLYSPISKEAKFYCGCFWHGHYENCLINPNATKDTQNDIVKKSYGDLRLELETKLNLLLQNNQNEVKSVSIYWECDYLKKRESVQQVKSFISNVYKPPPLFRLNPRSAIRGAFFDNFALRWLKVENPSENFYCLDLNGMYSFCAIKNQFMTGPYKVIIGPLTEKIKIFNGVCCFEKSTNIMHGTMLVTILPPKHIFFPYLLYRLPNGSTVNTLCSKCAENLQLTKCLHSDSERALTATYFISEINFALSLGYEIMTIHECHYFSRADFVLKDFIQKVNCLKIQNSNCLSNLSENEKETYCSFLNDTMELEEPFNLKPENVVDNPSAKLLYKLIANSLFGKLEQKQYFTTTKFASSQNQLEKFYFSNDIIKQIFCLNENLCQLEVDSANSKQIPNRESNCYIGGQLTAYARQLIYGYIVDISKEGRIFYTDCDSIYFSLPHNCDLKVPISDAVGHFKHVFPGEILSFYSLGPKCYVITYKYENEIKSISKVKGMSLAGYYTEDTINAPLFEQFMTDYLHNQLEKIQIPQMRTYHQKKSLKIQKKLQYFSFSNQVTTRRIVAKNCKYLTTFPYGNNFYNAT